MQPAGVCAHLHISDLAALIALDTAVPGVTPAIHAATDAVR
jgi:hypothetical protein